MAFLQVDYDRAIALAKDLETAAGKCEDSHRELIREKSNSEFCWLGESGDVLRIQAESAAKELKTLGSRLRGTAACIRIVAVELRRRDQETADKIRNSGGGSSW